MRSRSERISIRAASKDGYVYEGVEIVSASLVPQQTTINSSVALSVSVIEEIYMNEEMGGGSTANHTSINPRRVHMRVFGLGINYGY